jgi:hypothetical protein
MNAKFKLNLAAAGAGIALIGQASMLSEAIAGPSFSANSNQSYSAGANFSLEQGQSFEAIGNVSNDSTVRPFAVTATVSGIGNAPVAGDLNAGTSTLTAAFDRNGFLDTPNTPSFAVQAGVISIGGNAPTAGVTTGPVDPTTGAPLSGASNGVLKAGLALGIVLNQNTSSGVPSISITGAGSDSGIIGASITSQAIGASAASGTFDDNLTVINSLTAF